MKAWLLTWEGTEGPALIPDRKIAAILSYQRSAKFVAELVDVLYCRSVDSAHDMASLANNRKLREHQYMILSAKGGRLFYGRNPCIFARKVVNLTIELDNARNTELIRWTELAILENAKSGSGAIQTEPPRNCQHLRSIGPLSRDI
jgi:hypothetical protein